MKICPACHQDTFDGRPTCHRCGADVSDVIPLELPTEDVATLVSRLPFRSRRGLLRLSLEGLRFVDEAGAELLHIPGGSIIRVQPQGNADLRVDYRAANTERYVRLRVRWARVIDTTPAPPKVSIRRPLLPRRGSERARRGARARLLVRDRWESSLTALISTDRYALRRG